jgi:protein SCO1/2
VSAEERAIDTPLAQRRRARWRTSVAALLVFAAGLAMTYSVSDGLQAFSLESARRLHALRSPAPVPDLALEFADGQRARLAEVPGQVLLVDFIYTSCATYCQSLGSVYAQLQVQLASEIAADSVRLVSISFDPRHDGPEELRAYRARHTRETHGWLVGRPLTDVDLRSWLRAFGVVVIADGLGGYTHNAAIHVVRPDGKLAAIHDFDDFDGIVKTTREILRTPTRHAALR